MGTVGGAGKGFGPDGAAGRSAGGGAGSPPSLTKRKGPGEQGVPFSSVSSAFSWGRMTSLAVQWFRPPSNAGDVGRIPGREAKTPHALWPKKQNIKQKQYCNTFNKDFKNDPH